MKILPHEHIKLQLSRINGYCGIGWGLKEKNNAITSQLCWRIYVQRKIAKELLPAAQRLPFRIGGIITDIIEKNSTLGCSAPLNQALTGRTIANEKGVPGTLGCMAWSQTEKQEVLLTNYHVLISNGATEGGKIWVVNHENG